MATSKLIESVLKSLETFWESPSTPDIDAGGVLWRGVLLRPAAFDALGLPLAVQSGSIARLHVSAELGGGADAASNEGGLCLRVELEGLDLVLAEVDDEDSSRRLSVERQQRLAVLISDTRMRMHRLIGSVAAGSVLSQGFTAMLVGNLLDRVSIKIQNVHIRCLGGTAGGGVREENEFVVGVTCKLMSLDTSTQQSSMPQTKLKDVLVQGISVYWQRGAGCQDEAPPAAGEQIPEGACTLLKPLDINATTVIESLGDEPTETDGSRPPGRAWILRELLASSSAVHVRAGPEAITDMASLLQKGILEESRAPLQPPRSSGIMRPGVGYRKGAVSWWQYAQACLASRTRRERLALHQEALAQRVSDLKRYKNLYETLLDAALAASLGQDTERARGAAGDTPQALADEISDLECGLPLAAVIALRDACEDTVARQARADVSNPSSLLTVPREEHTADAAAGNVEAPTDPQCAAARRPLGYLWWLKDIVLQHNYAQQGSHVACTSPPTRSDGGAAALAHVRHVLSRLGFPEVMNGAARGVTGRRVTVRVTVEQGCFELCQDNKRLAASGSAPPGKGKGTFVLQPVMRVEMKRTCLEMVTFRSSCGRGVKAVMSADTHHGSGWNHVPSIHGKTPLDIESKAWVFSVRVSVGDFSVAHTANPPPVDKLIIARERPCGSAAAGAAVGSVGAVGGEDDGGLDDVPILLLQYDDWLDREEEVSRGVGTTVGDTESCSAGCSASAHGGGRTRCVFVELERLRIHYSLPFLQAIAPSVKALGILELAAAAADGTSWRGRGHSSKTASWIAQLIAGAHCGLHSLPGDRAVSGHADRGASDVRGSRADGGGSSDARTCAVQRALDLRMDLRLALPDVILVGVPSPATSRSARNKMLLVRCGTLVGRSVPVLAGSSTAPSAAVSSESSGLQHGADVVWRHKLSLDGSCIMSCARSDDWQEGLRRDLYLVHPFRSMLVVQATSHYGALATNQQSPWQHGAVKASVEVESIQVDGRLDKISSALDIMLSARSATAALDLDPESEAGQMQGSGDGGSGAPYQWWHAWTKGYGVGGLSGLVLKAVARRLQPLLHELARHHGPAASSEAAFSACLKRFTVLLRETSEAYVGAIEVLGSRVRLDLAKTSVKLECRRMLLLDSTRVQVPVENSCALEADADLVRLHKLLVDGESGSDGKAPGHGTASSSDAKTSKALVVALLDLGGPQCLSRSEGGGFQDGGGTKVGSGGQEREAGGFVVGEMRVLLQDDVGWRGKEIEARLDVGACRANVSLDGLANLQRFVASAISSALPASKQVFSQRLKTSSAPARAGVQYAARRPGIGKMGGWAPRQPMSCNIKVTVESLDVALLLRETPLLLEGAASQRGRAAASSEPCDTRAPGLSATSTPELRRDPAGFCRARTSSRGLEEVEEVVSVSVGKVVVEETMSLQQSRSSNYVHVQSLGVRCSPHLCGHDFATSIFTMPASAPPSASPPGGSADTAKGSGGSEGAEAASVCAFEGRYSNGGGRLGSGEASLHVTLGPMSGVGLLTLITTVSVAVKRSQLYLDNVQKMMALVSDVATRASQRVSAALDQKRVALKACIGGGCLRLPLGTHLSAGSLVLVCDPFTLSNVAGGEVEDVTTVDVMLHLLSAIQPSELSQQVKAKEWPSMWGLAVDEIWGLSVGLCVIRQLRLDRLDPGVARLKVAIMVVPSQALVEQLQLALVYRTVRWNAAQAEMVRAAMWTPDSTSTLAADHVPVHDNALSAMSSRGVNGGVGVWGTAGAVVAGAGAGTTDKQRFRMLDERKIGVRALDFKVVLQVMPLAVTFRDRQADSAADIELHLAAQQHEGSLSSPAMESGQGVEGSAGDRGIDGGWLVAEVGQVECVIEKWSDTSLKSHLTVGHTSLIEIDEGSGNFVKDLFVWGEGGGEPEGREGVVHEGERGRGCDNVGLRVAIESDGQGEEHRVDLKCAPVSLQLAPQPVLRLLNMWLTATYLDVTEAATYTCNAASAESEDLSGADHGVRSERGVGEHRHVATWAAMPKWRRRLLSLLQMPLEQDGVLKAYLAVPVVEVVVWEDGTCKKSATARVCCGLQAEYVATPHKHNTSLSMTNLEVGFRPQDLSTTSRVVQAEGTVLKIEMSRQYVEAGSGALFEGDSSDTRGHGWIGGCLSRLEVIDKVSFSEINLEIAYLDIKSGMAIATKWMAAARARGVLERHGMHQLVRAAQRAARAAAYSAVTSIMSAPSTPAVAASPRTPTTAMAASQKDLGGIEADGEGVLKGGVWRKFAVASGQMRLCIFNDCVGFNVPFAEVIVSPFVLSSAAAVRGLNTRGIVKLEANFYSVLNKCFEPVLEPIKMEVSSEIDGDVSGAYTLLVTTKHRAEFNLYETHVCSALATIEAWTSDLSAHVKLQDAADLLRAQKTKVWPYTLQNDSGQALRFWAGRSPVPPSETSVHKVASGATQVFAFATLHEKGAGDKAGRDSPGTRQNGVELHCITIEWAGDAGGDAEIVTNVPVDGEGVHMFALPSGQLIVVEISLGVRGTKMVCVQSVVKVCNQCDHEMEVGVWTRQGELIWSKELQPDAHMCLPIKLRNCYAIKVRPAGQQGVGLDALTYEWSDRILLPLRSQPSSLDTSVVTCLPAGAHYDANELDLSVAAGAGLRRYRARVDAKRPSADSKGSDEGASDSTGERRGAADEGSVRAVISLHPIFKIRNALPQTVTISLLAANVHDRNETALVTRTMLAGDILFLYNADRKTALGLVVLTQQLQSVCHPALIFHPAGEKLSTDIQLVDAALGTHLELNLDYDLSAWGDTTVVIYPPYILRNHSGLHLVYGHPASETAAPLGGSQGAMAAAGQDVQVSSEPSLLASLLGLALGLSQAARSWRLAGASARRFAEVTDSCTPSLDSTQTSLQGHDDEDEDVTNPRAAAARVKPEAAGSGASGSGAAGSGVKEGRGEAFCFSASAEAAASAGTASVQQGKLCLSVDGQVWSKAIDLERPAGTSSVVELAVAQSRAGIKSERLQFLGPRPVLEVAVHLDGARGSAGEAVPDSQDYSDGGAAAGNALLRKKGWQMYHKTRSVSLRPRFTLVNHTDLPLQAVQQGLEHWCVHALPPQSARLFHWGDAQKQRHVRLRAASSRPSGFEGQQSQGAAAAEILDSSTMPFPRSEDAKAGPGPQLEAGAEWSGALMLDCPGCFPMRVPTGRGGVTNCKAQVRVMGAATYVVVEEESLSHPSCLIVNALPHGWSIEAHQHQCTPSGALLVPSGSSQIVCWDEPHMPHRLQVCLKKVAGSSSGEQIAPSLAFKVLVDVDDLGAEIPINDELSIHVLAHGPTQVVRVSAAVRDGAGRVGRETLDDTAKIEKIMAPDVELVRRSLTLNLAGVGLSVLDGAVSEVLYLSATGLKASYMLGTTEASWEWKVSSLQIDNQTDVGGAVVLQSARAVNEDEPPAAGDTTPMLHMCIIRHLDRQLDWYRYIAVSLQEVRLAMHESVVLRCLEMLQAVINSSNVLTSHGAKGEKTQASRLWSRLFGAYDGVNDEEWWNLVEGIGGGLAGGAPPPEQTRNDGSSAGAGVGGTRSAGGIRKTERRVYVETMHLHPVLLHLQFTPTGEIAELSRRVGGSSSNVVSVLAAVKTLNLTLPSFEGASVAMNALIVTRVFASSRHLFTQVRKHYQKQYLKNLSPLDAFAAKTSATSTSGFFGGAMQDLFYEPAQALVTSPLEFEAALQQSQQRMARSIGSGAATLSHVSRSLGAGLSQLAGDPAAPGSGKPDDFDRGLAYKKESDGGGEGKGEKSEGEETSGSMFSGLSKGLLSGVLKPTAGMLDLASRSSMGLANAVAGAADSLEYGGRVRPPRPPSLDGLLRAYDSHAARGLDVMRRFDGGRYRADLFVSFLVLQSMDAVLLTDKHLAVMESTTLEKRFKLKISEIASVSIKGSGVLVSVKAPSASSSKYLTEALGVSTAVRERMLACGDLEKAEYLVSSIKACLLASRDSTRP